MNKRVSRRKNKQKTKSPTSLLAISVNSHVTNKCSFSNVKSVCEFRQSLQTKKQFPSYVQVEGGDTGSSHLLSVTSPQYMWQLLDALGQQQDTGLTAGQICSMESGERTLFVLVICHTCLRALQLLTCRTRKTRLSAFKSFVIQLLEGGKKKR